MSRPTDTPEIGPFRTNLLSWKETSDGVEGSIPALPEIEQLDPKHPFRMTYLVLVESAADYQAELEALKQAKSDIELPAEIESGASAALSHPLRAVKGLAKAMKRGRLEKQSRQPKARLDETNVKLKVVAQMCREANNGFGPEDIQKEALRYLYMLAKGFDRNDLAAEEPQYAKLISWDVHEDLQGYVKELIEYAKLYESRRTGKAA